MISSQEIVEIDQQIEDEIARGILPDPNQQMLEMEAQAQMPQDQMGMEQAAPAPQMPAEPNPNEGEI